MRLLSAGLGAEWFQADRTPSSISQRACIGEAKRFYKPDARYGQTYNLGFFFFFPHGSAVSEFMKNAGEKNYDKKSARVSIFFFIFHTQTFRFVLLLSLMLGYFAVTNSSHVPVHLHYHDVSVESSPSSTFGLPLGMPRPCSLHVPTFSPLLLRHPSYVIPTRNRRAENEAALEQARATNTRLVNAATTALNEATGADLGALRVIFAGQTPLASSFKVTTFTCSENNTCTRRYVPHVFVAVAFDSRVCPVFGALLVY